jgi:hypothetical protein
MTQKSVLFSPSLGKTLPFHELSRVAAKIEFLTASWGSLVLGPTPVTHPDPAREYLPGFLACLGDCGFDVRAAITQMENYEEI